MTAILWIKQLPQTIVACRQVGRDMHGSVAIRLGFHNLKPFVTFFGKNLCTDVSNHCLLRRFGGQMIKECADFQGVTFHLDRNAVRAVADKTAEAELRGLTINGRTKPNALDAANDPGAHARLHPRFTSV
jgi:hypothetical protein